MRKKKIKTETNRLLEIEQKKITKRNFCVYEAQ